MNPEDKEIRKRTLLIMVIIVVVIALIGVSYVVFHQRKQMDDMTELFAIEKEQLTDEYAELSLQYEGYKFSVGNDSLVALLTTEQMKVQRLMEELRTVKATNTRRITELKRLCRPNRLPQRRKRSPAQRERTRHGAISPGLLGRGAAYARERAPHRARHLSQPTRGLRHRCPPHHLARQGRQEDR